MVSSIIFVGACDSKRLTVDRTIYIENTTGVEIHALANTKDNGFIVAGKIGAAVSVNEAYAVRVNRDGHVLWAYHKPPVDLPPFASSRSPEPVYHQAVVMPDDSVFLCGQMPRDRKPGSGHLVAHGILTHLDKNGKVIDDVDLSPKLDGFPISAKLRSCISFGSGIFAVGPATKIWPDPQGAARGEPAIVGRDFLWAIYLSSDGLVRWERLVPLEKGPNRPTIWVFGGDAQVLLTQDNRVAVFSEAGTEGYLFDANGSVISRRIGMRPRMDEIFLPISRQDGIFSSYVLSATRFVGGLPIDKGGAYYNNADYNYVEFNSELDETRRTPLAHALNGEPRFRYQLADGSKVFFGTTLYSRSGHAAHVQLLGPEPDDDETIRLGDKGYSYHVDAVAPSNVPGAFVAARYTSRPFSNLPFMTEIDWYLSPITPKGVALDFIAVKPKL